MRFEEAYSGWGGRRLTQARAAELLGVCARTFRRYIHRYESEGLDGLLDKRMSQISRRRAPVDEVVRMVDRCRRRHEGWSVRHYYAWYRRDGGTRSYNWVRTHQGGAAHGRDHHDQPRPPARFSRFLLSCSAPSTPSQKVSADMPITT